MIIYVKYHAFGTSIPATAWVALDVLECYPRYVNPSYDKDGALDGTKFNFRQRYMRVSIRVGPLSMNSGTYRPVAEAVANNYYVEVKDTRHAALPDTATIKFIHDNEWDPTRDAPTMLAEDGVIELISESTQTYS